MLEVDRIYNEDCLEGMKKIPDKSIDCIICDLPYGTTLCSWDTVIPFESLWEQYRRIIRKQGNIILFAAGRFVFSLYNSQPDFYRYDLIWQKSRCGSFLTAKYMPMKLHEHILVFGDPASTYNPQLTNDGTPYRKNYDHIGRVNNHRYGIKEVHTDNHGERYPKSVLKFGQKWRRQDQVHPTQKPVELIQWLVRSYSNPGELVLDNCMGSGTTALACIREGRSFLGFETNKEYYDISLKRIEEERKRIAEEKEKVLKKEPTVFDL